MFVQSLYRTCEKRVRKYPPSFKEIAFVSKRQPIDARVHLPDGHQMLIEFDSAATADEVITLHCLAYVKHCAKKNTIHQVTTMVATSKKSYFQVITTC